MVELTILMPSPNEAETIGACIDKARSFLERHNLTGEVLIGDNGSTDGSQKIATDKGARVVNADPPQISFIFDGERFSWQNSNHGGQLQAGPRTEFRIDPRSRSTG